MLDNKLFNMMRLFMATAIKISEKDWLIDSRAFVLATEQLKENNIASSFWVTQVSTGKICPDFIELISLAHFADIIYYISPTYNKFHINISHRTAQKWLSEAKPNEITEMHELVKAYHSLTN